MASSAQATLLEWSAALDLPLTGEEADRLIALRDVILRFNRKVNLLGPCTPEQALERHLLDSLALRWLLDRRADLAPEACSTCLYDIGSGGGFPGLVLATLYPDVTCHLVEPTGKKASLVANAALQLGLRNVEMHNCRLAQLDPLEGPIWAVSRATFTPEEWVRLGRDFVGPGGAVIAMLGGSPASPLVAQAAAVHRFELPASGANRVNAVFLTGL